MFGLLLQFWMLHTQNAILKLEADKKKTIIFVIYLYVIFATYIEIHILTDYHMYYNTQISLN